MTLHVAVLFEFPTLNGGERSILSGLAELQSRRDFRFTALAPPAGMLAEALRELGVPLVSWNSQVPRPAASTTTTSSSGGAEERLSALLKCCQELEPDILHANSLSMSRLSGRLRRTMRTIEAGPSPNPADPARLSSVAADGGQHRLKRSLRCTGHIRDIVRLSAAAARDVNENDGLVAVSHATRLFHLQQGLEPDRICVIHNGIDTEAFRTPPQDHDETYSTARLNIPTKAFIILSVGQICLRKGQLDLAQAVVRLQTAEPARNLHLVIAGERYSSKPESHQYEQAIADCFESAGMHDRLHRPGYCADIRPLMMNSQLLVHAAHQEPFGRVLLEAAACQLPIVATDVGGTSELLRHAADALLIPAANPTAVAEAIRRSMDEPHERLRRAASAFTRVTTEFAARQAAEYLAAFWFRPR